VTLDVEPDWFDAEHEDGTIFLERRSARAGV
jgi:hypothetical protein